MNDFISTVRTDRQREIFEREKNGMLVSDKYRYRMVDTIRVLLSDGTELMYGFQANQKDVYFFIINDGANSYFSIVELYEILERICAEGNEDIVLSALECIKNTEVRHIWDAEEPTDISKAEWENKGTFVYRGITYHMKQIDYPEYEGVIDMFDGARTMSYKQLFVLINLIQEKSNAFFVRGEKKNVDLTNGIMRLFICLLRGNRDYVELEQIGWFYNYETMKYFLDETKIDKNGRKYYLTEDEFLSIMKAES